MCQKDFQETIKSNNEIVFANHEKFMIVIMASR